MTLSFELTEQPWLPAEMPDGSVREFSTRELLSRAHELRCLSDSSPIVVAALTRHLLAILHRSYDGPKSYRAWVAIANSGRFDEAKVNEYLDSVRDRMDLFHPTHPFAQTRGLKEQFSDYVWPIDQLELLRSTWGLGRALFRHCVEASPPVMVPSRAGRALLAHHAFATGGLIRQPNEPTAATAAPLVRCAVVILRGKNLFETLVCNLLRYDPEHDLPTPVVTSYDACSWERDAEPLPAELRMKSEPARLPTGYLEQLTWLSRRVELLPNGDGLITHYINSVGKGLADSAPDDPMVTYRQHEKYGWQSVGINHERGFWRDANALFETARGESARFKRPLIFDLLTASETSCELSEREFSIDLCGISAEKSRVDAERLESLQSTARVFNDPNARAAVQRSLEIAEKHVSTIRYGLSQFARVALAPDGKREPDAKAVSALTDSLLPVAELWGALGVEFAVFLRNLATDAVTAEETFCRSARRVVERMFQQAMAEQDNSGRLLQARVVAERAFAQGIRGRNATTETGTKEISQ